MDRKIDKSNTINEMKYYVFDSQSGGLTIYLLVKIINNNTVEIFSTNNEEYMDYMDYSENELTKLCSKNNLVKRFNYINKIFYDDHLLPNTLLLKLNNNKYVFISTYFYQFESKDNITNYISVTGGNGITSSIAYSNDNLYILERRVVIGRKHLSTKNIPSLNKMDICIYELLYELSKKKYISKCVPLEINYMASNIKR